MIGPAPTVVVPLDGSEFANRALPTAVRLAQPSGAPVILVGVAASGVDREGMRARLRDTARRLPPASVAAIGIDVMVGPDPASVLVEMARDPGNVVCVASRDLTRVGARVAGAVGSTLVDRARHPIVVVGLAGAASADGDVVVALDGVNDPAPLLAAGATWSRRLATGLRLVTVYEPVLPDVRRPSHFTREHGPECDPDAYLAAMKHRVQPRSAVEVTGVAIPDPVSVTAGLAGHLAQSPGALVVINGGYAHPTRARATVRHLLRTVPVPLLVVNRPEPPERYAPA